MHRPQRQGGPTWRVIQGLGSEKMTEPEVVIYVPSFQTSGGKLSLEQAD
jgi:hypothetical protein